MSLHFIRLQVCGVCHELQPAGGQRAPLPRRVQHGDRAGPLAAAREGPGDRHPVVRHHVQPGAVWTHCSGSVKRRVIEVVLLIELVVYGLCHLSNRDCMWFLKCHKPYKISTRNTVISITPFFCYCIVLPGIAYICGLLIFGCWSGCLWGLLILGGCILKITGIIGFLIFLEASDQVQHLHIYNPLPCIKYFRRCDHSFFIFCWPIPQWPGFVQWLRRVRALYCGGPLGRRVGGGVHLSIARAFSVSKWMQWRGGGLPLVQYRPPTPWAVCWQPQLAMHFFSS